MIAVTFIVWFILLGCTIWIYNLIFPNIDTLFYLNVVNASIAEGLILLNISALTSKTVLTFKRAATNTILVFLGITLFLWTSLYSVINQDPPFNGLYIGILVIVIIFTILIYSSETGGQVMEGNHIELVEQSKRRNIKVLSAEMFLMDMETLLKGEPLEWHNQINKDLQTAINKIRTIPVSKMSDNPEIFDNVNSYIEKIKEIGGELDGATDKIIIRNKIEDEISKLNTYLTTIKNII